jgi:feruloyl-CoA synthase
MSPLPLRQIRIWTPQLETVKRADGTLIVRQRGELPEYPKRITDSLVHWARQAPDRVWMARRNENGEWREITYGQALQAIRAIGQSLLDLGVSVESPLVILSDNSIEHALLALAAQHVGAASAAVSPAYSLVSTDFAKLKDIAAQLTPGLIYAEDAQRFVGPIAAAFDPGVPVVSLRNPIEGRPSIPFHELVETLPTAAVDDAHEQVGPDTVAKFLFTSGTTGSPKAVIQTHGMLTSNQAMVSDCYAFLADEPLVVVDWAPWNHTASGSKVFNLVLTQGGTFYIDEGKPTPAGIAETIRNLREISPTWYFNVPAGYDMLATAMQTDDLLRERFFARVKMLMYAGAGMAQHTWDDLNALAERTIGARVLIASGLGATETGPFALMCMSEQEHAGNIGIPARGVTLKLVPVEDKLEARLKSPSVTPGYWRNPRLTAEAFDEEGFYRLGDALRFAVPGDASQGFFFDGRLAENFKLGTGTWVSVGAVRARLVNDFGGLIRDAVLTGENEDELGAIVFPKRDMLAGLAGGAEAIWTSNDVREALQAALDRHAKNASGSAGRVTRIILAHEEPSIDRGEITDKGSINQRAVRMHRPDLIAKLYDPANAEVVRVSGGRR